MNERDVMLTSILKCRRIDLFTRFKTLKPDQRSRLNHMKQRRALGEPLQYIIGNSDFNGIPLVVDKRVLIPRPETEILTEMAVNTLRLFNLEMRIQALDLGTGSGNIAISLAKNIAACTVTAVDIDDGALAVAVINAKANHVTSKIDFLHQDMAVYLRGAAMREAKFDMIVSNPPYIPTSLMDQLPEEVKHEPKIALDGGDDGCKFTRLIIEYSHYILKNGGHLIMEIGDGQREYIEDIFIKYPQYDNINFREDYAGSDRIVCAQCRK